MPKPQSRRGVLVALLMVLSVALAVAVIVPSAPGRASAAGPAFVARPAGQASNGWDLVIEAPDYPNGEEFHFYGMTFPSREVGYAYGGQSWNAPDSDANGKLLNPGRVYRTRDGGLTWELVHESRGWKIGMACADETHCWMGGKRGQIYGTNNGGNTWFDANEYTWYGMDKYPTPPAPTPVPFTAWVRSATITTDGAIPIFGATDNTILRSTDNVNFYNYWPLLSWYSATWSVNCPSATVCYGGQIKRYVIKSNDAGAKWAMTAYVGPKENEANCLSDKYPTEGIQRRFYGLAFRNVDYGWVVGSCGTLFRTINGAQGWQAQNQGIPEEVTFRRIQAFSRTSALTVGGTNPNPADASMALDAIIYRTTDGVTWTPVAAPETSELHGLAAFADATFVADWSGKIWRYDGEIAPVPPTRTPTATATVTATPTETPVGAQLEVVAFHDINLNGQPDDAAPLPNVGFEVRRESTPVATGATGSDGRYVFSGLSAGDHTVAITTPAPGYTAYYSQIMVGVPGGGGGVTVPFPHRMSTVTPTRSNTWLPLLLQ
jgi:hypothetical protein